MRTPRTTTACLALFLLAAVTPAASQPQKKTTEEQLKDMAVRLDVLETWLADVDGRTGQGAATLDCANGGFSEVTAAATPLTFLVTCSQLEPYLEGYRLTLTIGNPFAMQFDGISAKVGYGENLLKSYTQTTETQSTAVLRPGLWTTINVVINRVAAKDVRVIAIRELKITRAQGVSR